jgi:2-polyprenyl-3-methyl-5-hydroxy-6-metoxy-1,4-benzoquinol methylase
MEFKLEERSCIVCGSTEKEVFNKRDPWTKAQCVKDKEGDLVHDTDVICNKCGLIYKNPMMTRETMREFYEGGDYLNTYKAALVKTISKSWLVENVVTTVYILDFLKECEIDLEGKLILDIGAGSGTLMKGLGSLGADVYGIEPCERHCEIAEKVYGSNVYNISLEDFHTDAKFDFITISNTLEHFYDPNEVLEKMKSMLAPGGSILIEVPSAKFPYPATLTSAFLSSAHNYTFQKDNMASLLRKHGFRTTHFEYAGHKNCMIFVAKAEDGVDIFSISAPDETDSLSTGALKDRAKAAHNVGIYAQQLIKELLEGSSVNSINETINTRYSLCSNILRYVVANKCFEIGQIEDGLGLIQQPYEKAQSADFNYCQGSQLFTIAIGYRMLGDFITAKRYLGEAMRAFPGIEKYNFVKEMYVDGIISESGFSQHSWFSCKTLLKSFS